jgi:TRAP-type C4-dicarboxylate transport system substrate-binding protein
MRLGKLSLRENKIQNIVIVGSGEVARNFYNSKREIKTIDDLKGLKIRVMESNLMVNMVKSLGAVPQPMAFGEVYSAIKTGVVDGAENNLPSYVSTNHFEVAKYITLDAHNRVPELLIASKMGLENKNISKEDIELIKQAAKESVEFQKKEWNKTEKEAEEKAKAAGCIFTTLDAATLLKFQEAVKTLYDEEAKDYVDLIQKIKDTK